MSHDHDSDELDAINDELRGIVLKYLRRGRYPKCIVRGLVSTGLRLSLFVDAAAEVEDEWEYHRLDRKPRH